MDTHEEDIELEGLPQEGPGRVVVAQVLGVLREVPPEATAAAICAREAGGPARN